MQRFFLFGALLLAFNTAAQSFTKVYSAGNNSLQFTHIEPNPGGGWYAAGYARNSTEIASFVSKFDAFGTLLWSKKPAESRDPRALVRLNDGSLLFFNNNGGFQGYFDASMLHMGADGSFISETIWGKPDDQDDWFDAKKMSDGTVVAIGMTRESSSFSERILLAKFSATGQILWEKTLDGGLFSRFSSILPLPSGDFYAIGQSFGFGGTLSLLGKFSVNGDLDWIKSYQYGTDESYFLAGQTLSDGSLFVAAYQTSFSVGNPKLTLLNLSASGDITNQKTLDNDYDLGAFKMGKLNDETLLSAAVTNGQVFPLVDNDHVILQVSPQGDLLGHMGFGSDAQDFGADAFFLDRQVILCGMSDTSLDGSARRATISRSGFKTSCCEKNVAIVSLPPPPLPIVSVLPFAISPVPGKQNHTVSLADFPLSSVVSCQNPDGTALLPVDTSLCIGDTLRIGLITNIPADIQWSTGATGTEILVDAPGIYTVNLSGECGVANDTIEVVALGKRVVAAVIPDLTACPGESIGLFASGGTNYRWLNANGTVLFTDQNPSVRLQESTIYQVIVNDGQCLDTATVQVSVLPGPMVAATPDAFIKAGEKVVLSASGASNYIWSPEAGLSCTDCPDPVASPAFTTTYTVLGLDANGCSDTASITVNVRQPCPFYIPNVIYPEDPRSLGNGLFGVLGQEIAFENFLLRIFSRWGELVFESKDPSASWDGTIQNKTAQAGVYLYQLEMVTCDGLVRKHGDLTLIR